MSDDAAIAARVTATASEITIADLGSSFDDLAGRHRRDGAVPAHDIGRCGRYAGCWRSTAFLILLPLHIMAASSATISPTPSPSRHSGQTRTLTKRRSARTRRGCAGSLCLRLATHRGSPTRPATRPNSQRKSGNPMACGRIAMRPRGGRVPYRRAIRAAELSRHERYPVRAESQFHHIQRGAAGRAASVFTDGLQRVMRDARLCRRGRGC